MATLLESQGNARTDADGTTPLSVSTTVTSGTNTWIGIIAVYNTTTSGVTRATLNGTDIIQNANQVIYEQRCNTGANFVNIWSIPLGDNPATQTLEVWVNGLTKPCAAGIVMYDNVDQTTPLASTSFEELVAQTPDITFSNSSGQTALAMLSFDDGGEDSLAANMPAISQGTEHIREYAGRTECYVGETTVQNGTVEWGTGTELQSYQTDAWRIDGLVLTDAVSGDTTKPSLNTATCNATTLTLTYSENLDESSTPAPEDFTVSGSVSSTISVSSVDVTGTDVTLVLGSSVRPNETVTVSYTPGVNPIQDTAGNDADSLSSQSVTNNTPDPVATITHQGEGSTLPSGVTVTTVFYPQDTLDTASQNISDGLRVTGTTDSSGQISYTLTGFTELSGELVSAWSVITSGTYAGNGEAVEGVTVD